MVGGDDYNTSPFNLATQGQRQPGSAFKPFVLAEALKKGISPTSLWSSRKKVFDVPGSSEKFTVENYSDAYAGVTTLAARDDDLRQLGVRRGRHQDRHQEDRQARAPDGHPHAGLAQLGDDARRPQGGRDAARHGARLRDVRAQGQAHLRLAQPGLARQGPAGARARSASARSRASDDGKLKPITLPNGDKAKNRVETRRVLDEGIANRSGRSSRASSRTARRKRAPARPADPGGRQDRHDRELRRRLVRRLDARVHRRRVGRLPEEVPADEDRVPGRAGGRRHVPGRDLEDVHGVRAADRPAAGAQGQGRGRGRRPRRDRRPGRHRGAGAGRARAVAARAEPRPRPTAAAGRRPAQPEEPAPEEPSDIPPAEQPPDARPRAATGETTPPSGGTAPPANGTG